MELKFKSNVEMKWSILIIIGIVVILFGGILVFGNIIGILDLGAETQKGIIRKAEIEGNWTIDGDAVFMNDSRAYIRASPHTLTSSGWVYFNLTSKIYEGDVDVVFGFNTTNAKPRRIEFYNPHNITRNTTHLKTFYNVTSFTDTSANCDYGYEYNTFKKNGTYYDGEERGSDWNKTSAVVCYDSYYQEGNAYTLTWHQEHPGIEDYVDKTSLMSSTDYEYGGMNKWWYITNIPINKDQNYMFRGYVDVPISGRGKYGFAIKPSNETIQEAIANNHFYYLDPWWEITEADHLDENRAFISDIYNETRALDDIWSETIPSGDYVRVAFETNLTSDNDITIYPRTISGNPSIEVYEKNGTDLIAEFTTINDNQYNKVYLTNLQGSQDIFDLKILGGDVQFDHIVDPDNPNLTSVILNSTSFNLTSDNLTAYPVNASGYTTLIYDWRKENKRKHVYSFFKYAF
jgi:ribosome-associated toxin RatA of RatAB toxin-antitoxin module